MPLVLTLDSADRTPIHAQVERGIRAAIAAGRLPIGDQLPTVRQLAVDLRVNANTVAKVYAHLERDGVLETRRGVGTFVAVRTVAEQDLALRRSELRRIVDRFLAELSSHGFRVDEAVPEIEARRQQGA
ncbi:MAG: GntR family transcriptional regulator [Acidobacteria bacterium]|nr:MAG: GntR family transcriptional regulator [Acidobacteriota bacterium]